MRTRNLCSLLCAVTLLLGQVSPADAAERSGLDLGATLNALLGNGRGQRDGIAINLGLNRSSGLLVRASVPGLLDLQVAPVANLTAGLSAAAGISASAQVSASLANLSVTRASNQPNGLLSTLLPIGNLLGPGNLGNLVDLHVGALQGILNAAPIRSPVNLSVVTGLSLGRSVVPPPVLASLIVGDGAGQLINRQADILSGLEDAPFRAPRSIFEPATGTRGILSGLIATDVTRQPGTGAARRASQESQMLAGLTAENVDASGLIYGTSIDSFEVDQKAGQLLKLTQRPDSNKWKLEQGNVLFTPKEDIVVQTQDGDVHVPGGAVVFIMETGHDCAVYDLHDSRSGSIKVVAGKRVLTLAPGRQVVLTRRIDDKFEDVNPGKRIGYRRVKDVVLSEGVRAHVSDFSIASAASVVKPIRNLLTSDKPQDRKMVNRMLKNAAILSEMTAAIGPYRAAQ